MYKNKRDIWSKMNNGGQHIAILLDPEKIVLDAVFLAHLKAIEAAGISFLFVGGSTVSRAEQESCVSFLKANTSLPIVIFPGSPEQITNDADALLLLSLISGRNPDFLIGHHVSAARQLHNSYLEIIPTAYVLVDGGRETAVQRVSQTSPISRNDFDLLWSTALAGVMMGNQLVYLDAGSGAEQSVPTEWIAQLSQEIDVPIIVGGGIRNVTSIEHFFSAGANLVVIGNHVECKPAFLDDIKSITSKPVMQSLK
jgi:phosphoglycerol geranylgeranyltransferase